jgi:hypothetical protein
VDGADLAVWQGSYENTGANLPADGDDDGDVDGADFLIWQANLGAPSGGGAAAVPEPASWLLALGAAVAALRFGARRRKY